MTSRREWPEAVPCRSCGRTTVPAQVGARRKLVWLNSDSEGRPRRYRDDLSGNRYQQDGGHALQGTLDGTAVLTDVVKLPPNIVAAPDLGIWRAHQPTCPGRKMRGERGL